MQPSSKLSSRVRFRRRKRSGRWPFRRYAREGHGVDWRVRVTASSAEDAAATTDLRAVGYCQVDEKLVDRHPRYRARASREPAMLGIRNGRQPQLDNTAGRPPVSQPSPCSTLRAVESSDERLSFGSCNPGSAETPSRNRSWPRRSGSGSARRPTSRGATSPARRWSSRPCSRRASTCGIHCPGDQ